MVSINLEPSHIRIFSKKKLSIHSTIDKIDWNCETMIASISEFDNVILQIKRVKTCCVSLNKIFLRGSGIDNFTIFQDRDSIARVTRIRYNFNTILTWKGCWNLDIIRILIILPFSTAESVVAENVVVKDVVDETTVSSFAGGITSSVGDGNLTKLRKCDPLHLFKPNLLQIQLRIMPQN